jgi:hypothetical protein
MSEIIQFPTKERKLDIELTRLDQLQDPTTDEILKRIALRIQKINRLINEIKENSK